MDNSWIPITLEELLALTLEGTKILVTSEGSQVYYKREPGYHDVEEFYKDD